MVSLVPFGASLIHFIIVPELERNNGVYRILNLAGKKAFIAGIADDNVRIL